MSFTVRCWCDDGHEWESEESHENPIPTKCKFDGCKAQGVYTDLVVIPLTRLSDSGEEGVDWVWAIDSTMIVDGDTVKEFDPVVYDEKSKTWIKQSRVVVK